MQQRTATGVSWRKLNRSNKVAPAKSRKRHVAGTTRADISLLEAWAAKVLKVPPGHPASGQPMVLPNYGSDYLADVLRSDTREALLCLGRKNAKSALVALLCLGFLCGPLAGKGGWRAGVASVNKAKSKGANRPNRGDSGSVRASWKAQVPALPVAGVHHLPGWNGRDFGR